MSEKPQMNADERGLATEATHNKLLSVRFEGKREAKYLLDYYNKAEIMIQASKKKGGKKHAQA